MKIEGPLADTPGRLSELLHLSHHLWRMPSAHMVAFYQRTRPDLVEVARTLPAPDSGASLAEAFSALNEREV